MSNLVIMITDAGRAEIINAANTGTEKVLISQIGIGKGTNPSTPTQTSLQNEIKRLTTFGGAIVASDVIHVSVKDTGSDAYEVHEVGLYTDKGTLFAVYSQAAPILEKTASSIMLLAVDVTLQTLDTDNITFGDIEFVNPPASEKTVGVSRFATDAEAAKGEADDLMLSPKRAKPLFDARQPLSTALTSLAALVSGANKLPYFTGGKNDEMALTDLTAFMRVMLGKNDISGVLQYLGLGELAKSPRYLVSKGENANGWYEIYSDGFKRVGQSFNGLAIPTPASGIRVVYPISFTTKLNGLYVTENGNTSNNFEFANPAQIGFTGFNIATMEITLSSSPTTSYGSTFSGYYFAEGY